MPVSSAESSAHSVSPPAEKLSRHSPAAASATALASPPRSETAHTFSTSAGSSAAVKSPAAESSPSTGPPEASDPARQAVPSSHAIAVSSASPPGSVFELSSSPRCSISAVVGTSSVVTTVAEPDAPQPARPSTRQSTRIKLSLRIKAPPVSVVADSLQGACIIFASILHQNRVLAAISCE